MTAPAGQREFATLTARLLAGIVDLMLLSAAAVVLHLLWHGTRAPMADAAVVIIATLYFILGHGPVGGGYTIGKRALGIRVVDAAGAPLTLSAATARWLVAGGIVSPLLVVAPDLLDMTPPGSIAVLAVLILLLCMFWTDGYLLLANRATRRSLHDLAGGSFVVRRGHEGAVAATPVARASVIGAAVTSLAIAALILSAVPRMRVLHDRFIALRAAQQVVSGSHGVRTLFVSPAFTTTGADTAWVVNLFARVDASPATVAEADDIGLALVCAVERNAPRPFRGADVVALLSFDGGAVTSPIVRFWNAPTDASLEACDRTRARF